MNQIESFFNRFLTKTNRDKSTKFVNVDHFELNEKASSFLLSLVKSGQKKATSSSEYTFQAENIPLPKPGDLSIITDFHGKPELVLETTQVTLIKFKDMTFAICAREGEDDTLESWIKSHTKYFKEEAKELGYTFSEDLIVVFEDFQVVYQE